MQAQAHIHFIETHAEDEQKKNTYILQNSFCWGSVVILGNHVERNTFYLHRISIPASDVEQTQSNVRCGIDS